jgi:hypothetical protein
MQIIQGGKKGGKKPEPENLDTFLKDLLLTHEDICRMLETGQIGKARYDQLKGEL